MSPDRPTDVSCAAFHSLGLELQTGSFLCFSLFFVIKTEDPVEGNSFPYQDGLNTGNLGLFQGPSLAGYPLLSSPLEVS